VIRDKLLEKYKITGTCDGVLQWCVEGKWSDLGIVDIKTCSANLFASYNNLESLKRHTWSTMYPAQVMTYAFASDYERGFLLFVSKGNIFYDWKIIEVPVDMEQVEGLLTKCEAVNKSLDAGTEPVRINRPFWCADCKWQSLCLPEFTYNGSGPAMNEDKEVERIVNRLQEIKPHWSEYEELKKTLRKSLCEGQPLILENAMIDWKMIHGQRQPSPGGPFEYWKMTITSTNDDDDE